MLVPRSNVHGGTLLLGFLLFGDVWFANEREEGAWCGEEINI
jgi:hypothetical protein